MKVMNYIRNYSCEIKYRILYILLYSTITLWIVLVNWNESIMILLEPIEDSFNSVFYNYIISEHYISEDYKSYKHIDLTKEIQFNNDIPFFEISINEMTDTDSTIIKVASVYITVIAMPFICHQILLTLVPMMYKSEISVLLKWSVKVILAWYITVFFAIKISLPIIMNIISIGTEEISNYEFEVEFSIKKYSHLFVIVFFSHIIPIILTLLKRFNKLKWLLLISTLCYVLINCNIAETVCLLVLYALTLVVKNIYDRLYRLVILIRHSYHVTLHR